MEKYTDKELNELISIISKEHELDLQNISDGHHTFKELYHYRMLYNALIFNEWAKQNLYNVHKSKRHNDGNKCFDSDNWFIVVAELPTGQISNHYEIKNWDMFKIPEVEKSITKFDNHTPKDCTNRIENFITNKKKRIFKKCKIN